MGIPASRCTRWQPGIIGGIPERKIICATIDARVFGNGKADASEAIQGAVSACQEGRVVYLPPGTYRISKGIVLNKGVVLRGAGPDRTRIRFEANSGVPVYMTNLWPEYRNAPVNVTADVPKGTSRIPVASARGFAVGDIITLDQLDDPAYVVHGGCRWLKRGPDQADDRRPVSADGYRAQGQTAEIAAIEGDVLTLSTPVHLGYRFALKPQVYKPSGPMTPSGPTVKYAGLEDLYLTGGRNGMILMINAAFSWVRNVESDGSPVTGAGMTGGHVALESCYRCVVRDSYFHDATRITQGGGAYGISLQSQTSDSLVENNIVVNLNKPLVMRASGGGNVIAYNYVDDAWTDVMPSLQETTIDGGHASFPHMELFEGNWAAHLGTDAVWGNAGWLTFFRNYASAQQRRTPLVPETYDVAAIALEANGRFMNVIGNVLGVSGKGLIYEVHSRAPGTGQPAVYRIGHRSNGGNGGGESNRYEDPRKPGSTASTLLRHGNFDYVTHRTIWSPEVAARMLPPSLYLTERPAFFGDRRWPWVDPAGETRVHALPAKERFDRLNALNAARPR
jgi:Pectate lyase superfamily protein